MEETRREDVKVSFGDELEKILLTAVENGDVQFIQNIFRREVGLLYPSNKKYFSPESFRRSCCRISSGKERLITLRMEFN